MLTVLHKGTFMNNETKSSETNMYSSFSWTNGGISLILLTASKESLRECSFCAAWNGYPRNVLNGIIKHALPITIITHLMIMA